MKYTAFENLKMFSNVCRYVWKYKMYNFLNHTFIDVNIIRNYQYEFNCTYP